MVFGDYVYLLPNVYIPWVPFIHIERIAALIVYLN